MRESELPPLWQCVCCKYLADELVIHYFNPMLNRCPKCGESLWTILRPVSTADCADDARPRYMDDPAAVPADEHE